MRPVGRQSILLARVFILICTAKWGVIDRYQKGDGFFTALFNLFDEEYYNINESDHCNEATVSLKMAGLHGQIVGLSSPI